MRLGQIGGALAIGGWALIVIAIAIAATGGAVGIGTAEIGGLVLAAALTLIGSGAALVGIAGQSPLDGRAVRIGLVILAVGLVSSLGSSIIAAGSQDDPLASVPFIVFFLLGAAATALGAVVTVLSLLSTRGLARILGALLAAGLALLTLAWILGSRPSDIQSPGGVGGILALLGGIAIVLGGAGVGALAIRGDRSPAVASA